MRTHLQRSCFCGIVTKWSAGDTGFTWFDLRSAEGSLLVPLWRQCLDRSWHGGFLLVARCARAFLVTKISRSTAIPSLFSEIQSRVKNRASMSSHCLSLKLLGLLKIILRIEASQERNATARRGEYSVKALSCQDFGWDYIFSTFHDSWPPSVTACALAHWQPVPNELPSALRNE